MEILLINLNQLFMKTKGLFAAAMLLGGIVLSNGQTNIATSTLTSRGLNAGTTGSGGAYFGYRAGYGAPGYSESYRCTFIGNYAGQYCVGAYNVFLGFNAGGSNLTSSHSVYIGYSAGSNIREFPYDVIIGSEAGANAGGNNVIVGRQAGYNLDEGSGNILLGYKAGYNETGSNKLYIENSDSTTPLIWGDFNTDQLKFNGKVGIGLGTTAFPTTAYGFDVSTYKLIVNGGVLAKEVRVATDWADYVFEKDYQLRTLTEVEEYIKNEGHLPNMPSAEEIEKSGIEVGDMAKMQQEKIEELTLYTIAQQKQLEAQQQQLAQQQKEIEELKAAVNALINK